ncbi:MAG: hypothetical protein AAFQ51_09425 [Pseudomonadota bacterium]
MRATIAAPMLLSGLAACSALPGLVTSAKDAVVAEFDTCKTEDAGPFVLMGTVLRTDATSGEVTLANASGRMTPDGALSRVFLGLEALDTSPTSTGFSSNRDVSGTSLTNVTSPTAGLAAYDLTFPSGTATAAGSLVMGVPSAGTAVPTTGQTVFSGPIRMRADLSGATTAEATGTITVTAGYASQSLTATVTDLGPTAAFSKLTWTGLAPCNTRFGSAGRGTVQALDARGRRVNLVGASATSPLGTAILSGVFYGPRGDASAPRSVGGVLLLSGDTGTVSGVFLADAQN